MGCSCGWSESSISSHRHSGVHMWRLGLGQTASVAPSEGLDAQLLWSWCLNSAELHLWSALVDLWTQHLHSRVWGAPRAVLTTVHFVSLHSGQHHRTHSLVDGSRRWVLKGSSQNRSFPTLPTLHYSSEINLGASTPTTKKQSLLLAELWQTQSKGETPFSIQCRLW